MPVYNAFRPDPNFRVFVFEAKQELVYVCVSVERGGRNEKFKDFVAAGNWVRFINHIPRSQRGNHGRKASRKKPRKEKQRLLILPVEITTSSEFGGKIPTFWESKRGAGEEMNKV